MNDGPVIPDFGQATECVRENRLFCTEWVRENWRGWSPVAVGNISIGQGALGASARNTWSRSFKPSRSTVASVL